MFRYFKAKQLRDAGQVPEGTSSVELLARVSQPATIETLRWAFGAGAEVLIELGELSKKLHSNNHETDRPSTQER